MEEITRRPIALCLLDEFSYFCFQPEFDHLIPINPKDILGVQNILENTKIDLFLCETVWDAYQSGYDIGNIPPKLKKKRLLEMSNLTKLFESYGIPTIFWNKEDNKHYQKFKAFASLFNYILTTDVRTLKDYRRECPRARKVDVMIFAAQPLIHNPIRDDDQRYEGDVFFAGKWYEFPERKKELEELLNLPRHIKLDIYDRSFRGRSKTRFPKRLAHRVKRGLTYKEVVQKYKKYPIMINANSVKGSTTMFSRRVPEALCCDITVLTSPSRSLKNLFGSNLYFVRDRQEATKKIEFLLRNPTIRKRNDHNARRKILQKHTYFNRLQQICQMISFPIPKLRRGVIIVRILSNHEELDQDLYDQMKDQTYPDIVDNIAVDIDDYEQTFQTFQDLFIFRSVRGYVFEEVGFVAIVHPNNQYGMDYILDGILSYQYLPDTRLIGKASIYTINDGELEHVYPELEQTYTKFIHPHTFIYTLKGSMSDNLVSLKHLLYNLGDQTLDEPDIPIYSVDSYSFISGT